MGKFFAICLAVGLLLSSSVSAQQCTWDKHEYDFIDANNSEPTKIHLNTAAIPKCPSGQSATTYSISKDFDEKIQGSKKEDAQWYCAFHISETFKPQGNNGVLECDNCSQGSNKGKPCFTGVEVDDGFVDSKTDKNGNKEWHCLGKKNTAADIKWKCHDCSNIANCIDNITDSDSY